MRILLELDAEVARSLQRASSTHAAPPKAAALQRLVAQLGLHLQSMHPGVVDPRLATWFFVDLADDGTTGATLEQLRQCEAVTAAYPKPVDEAPR